MGNKLCNKHFFTKRSDTNHPPTRKSPEIIHDLNVTWFCLQNNNNNNNNTAHSWLFTTRHLVVDQLNVILYVGYSDVHQNWAYFLPVGTALV